MQIQSLIEQDELFALTGHDAATVQTWIAAGKLHAHVQDDGIARYDRTEALSTALAWEQANRMMLTLQLATWIDRAAKRKQTADRNHATWLERAQEWTAKEEAYQIELEDVYEQLDETVEGVPEMQASLQSDLNAALSARQQMEQAYALERSRNDAHQKVIAQADAVCTDLKQHVTRLKQQVTDLTRDVEHWQKCARTAEVESEQWRYRLTSWKPPVAPFPPIDHVVPRWRAAFFGLFGMVILLGVLLFLDSGMGVVTRDAQDVKAYTSGSSTSLCDPTTTFTTRSNPTQILNLYHRNLTLRGWWRTSQLNKRGVVPQATYYRWWDRAHRGQRLEVLVPSQDSIGRSNVVVMTCEHLPDTARVGQS